MSTQELVVGWVPKEHDYLPLGMQRRGKEMTTNVDGSRHTTVGTPPRLIY